MSKFVSEFKEFISRGNVVDMAVGIIMGSAFTAIVTSLVDDLIMPVIGMICAGVNIAELSVQVGSATLKYGAFLQAVLNFLIIALVIFSMVKAINSARAKAESLKKKKEEETPKEEEKPDPQIVLLEEIRDLLAAGRPAAREYGSSYGNAGSCAQPSFSQNSYGQNSYAAGDEQETAVVDPNYNGGYPGGSNGSSNSWR